MKRDLGLGLALLVCGLAQAAEPPSRVSPATAPGSVGKPAAAAKPAPATAAQRPKPLDLRVGDVRKYMMPRDFQTMVHAPDAEANTVVVEGERELAPMRQVEDVPMGLASLWYAARSPGNSWRLLAPVVTFKDGPTVDKVPPPVFRWGP